MEGEVAGPLLSSKTCVQWPTIISGLYREVVSVQRSKERAFGTQSSGLYREVVSVQGSKERALVPNQSVFIERDAGGL